MENERYRFRRAESPADADKLHDLYWAVFQPEDVATLAATLFHEFPGMEPENWFIAEEKSSGETAAAVALIPWTWDMEGVPLKVAEMGLVGTREKHRGAGLMHTLNRIFTDTLMAGAYDLAVIQGIPGFYHRLGFHYAVPLENHLEVPFHRVPEPPADDGITLRPAVLDDIPLLMRADERYRAAYWLSAIRTRAHWHYLLTGSRKTEYGSEYWIIEEHRRGETAYCRIPTAGFGQGLIVSEVSENIGFGAWIRLLNFLKKTAMERGKPYIRFNVHNASAAGAMLCSLGVKPGSPYAWQVKIPSPARLLEKMGPVLEKRVQRSCYKDLSEPLRLDFFNRTVDLHWRQGRFAGVSPGTGTPCRLTFCINADLFAPLCLGHRTWRELQHVRPDIFPARQYIRPESAGDPTGHLMDILFPAQTSWIVEQY